MEPRIGLYTWPKDNFLIALGAGGRTKGSHKSEMAGQSIFIRYNKQTIYCIILKGFS